MTDERYPPDEGPPEFSRLFDCTSIGAKVRTVRIEADEEERAALARRFDIPAIGRLEAELTLTPRAGDTIEVGGHVAAEVTRICVVSLEPFDMAVEEDFDLLYAPEGGAMSEQGEGLPLEDEEWREPIVDGRIDLGEAVAQQLSLALDPHPRAPGVSFETVTVGRTAEDEAAENPLKGLADLTRGRGKR